MEKRRALADSLPLDAQEFIHGATVSKSASQQVSKKADIEEIEEHEPTDAITVRLPRSVLQQWREIITRRKGAKKPPYTQQGALLQALMNWIEENR